MIEVRNEVHEIKHEDVNMRIRLWISVSLKMRQQAVGNENYSRPMKSDQLDTYRDVGG